MHTISPILHLWKGRRRKKKKSPNEQINKKNKANKKSQISKNEHATAQRNAKISSPSFYSTVDSHSTHQENYIKTTTTTTEGRQDLLYNPAGFCTLTFISDIYFGTRVVGLGETSLDTSWHTSPWCNSSEHWGTPLIAAHECWTCNIITYSTFALYSITQTSHRARRGEKNNTR